MKKRLDTSLCLVNEGVRFHATAAGKNPIVVDYFAPPEDKAAYTSLELLLISASSCLASAVKLILADRYKEMLSAIDVKATGIRKENHPTAFSQMTFRLECVSASLKQETLEAVIQVAEKQICPVFAMLKDDVRTKIEASIERPDMEAATEKGEAV